MKRMKINWYYKRLFEVSAQRLLDQVRVIKTNEYSSEVELKEIRRKVKIRNNEEMQVNEQQDNNFQNNKFIQRMSKLANKRDKDNWK